ASVPMVFSVGKLLDVMGRRRGSLLIFGLTSAGVLISYTAWNSALLTVGLTFGIFGATAVLPVLNAYNTELFPTDIRGDAFSWSNNLLGRIGYVFSPLAVGVAATSIGWGPAVAATAIFPLIAVVLILTWLPETSGRELEETSQLT
ncbi:MAG: MFS transporter, partial [Myxococcales bacterium]|nr:MFS transporter [Myxococcales bacterium]